MSVDISIKKQRAKDVVTQLLSEGTCVFYTLTTPDVVDFLEIRSRWRAYRHELCRSLPQPVKYVMNYEFHPKGHGWHIHSLFNRLIPLKRFLPISYKFGFGRQDVRLAASVDVSEYLTKHCLKAYRGFVNKDLKACRLRLVNTSRGFPRLSDYKWSSSDLKLFRYFVRVLSFKGICNE